MKDRIPKLSDPVLSLNYTSTGARPVKPDEHGIVGARVEGGQYLGVDLTINQEQRSYSSWSDRSIERLTADSGGTVGRCRLKVHGESKDPQARVNS